MHFSFLKSSFLRKVIILFWATPVLAGVKPNRFQELIKPVDLETLYEKNVKTVTRRDLYSAILERNLDLKQSRIDLDIANQSRDLVYIQMFVPRTTLTGDWNQNKSVSSILSSARTLNLGLAIGATTDIGLSYQLSLPKLSLTRNYDGVFDNLNSQTASAGAEGSVTFSLLRGSIFFSNGLSRESADLDRTSAELSLKSTMINNLTTAENSFYDILLQEMRCKVQERTVQASKALLENVNEMIRLGDSDQLSRTQVELQVAQAEVDLFASRSSLNTAKAALRNQLAMNVSETQDVFPEPKELYVEPKIPKLTLDQAIILAKKKRPDFLNANIALRKAHISKDNALSQRMPQLDLKATSGYGANSDNISNAVSNLTRFGEMSYGVGFSFLYQFFEDSDKFGHRQSILNLRKAEMALLNINNQIWRDLSALLDNIEISKAKLKISNLTRVLAERKIAAEFLRFKSGESNVRNVIDFQFELATARITEITSRVELQKLWTSLRAALGELPEGVDFQ